MTATARLLEHLDAEILTAPTEDGGAFVVALVVPGEYGTAEEAEQAADDLHRAISEAMADDLDAPPIRTSSERLALPDPTPEETR